MNNATLQILNIPSSSLNANSVDDRRLVLANSQWASRLTISDNWNYLRIGFRFEIENTNYSVYGTPYFYCGLLSTPSASMINGPLTQTTSHFVGIRSNENIWNINSDTGGSYYDCGGSAGSYNLVKRTGSVELVTPVSSNFMPTRQFLIGRRCVGIIDIIKGSPDYTFQGSYLGNGGHDVVSEHILESAMSISSLNDITSYLELTAGVGNYVTSVAPTISVDESSDGILDSICFAWNRTWPVVYISDVMWKKLS